MRSGRTLLGAGIAALLVIGTGTARGESPDHDWPQFRGHQRDGISRETGLLADWPDQGPPETWRVEIGEGYSGIAVVGDRLYTMYATAYEGDDEAWAGKEVEFAAAFEAHTGKEVWRTPIDEKLTTEFGNGPRATPTVDGEQVFVLSSQGRLAALDKATGNELWSLSLTETFGGQRPYWGFAASALVDGDQVVIEGGGGEGKSYVALDRESGEVLWTSGDGGAGYNSAIAVQVDGQTRYIYLAGGKLRAIDPTGEEIWSHEWPRGETHASPVFIAPDRVYASGAEGVGGRLFRVREGSDGVEVEQLWEEPRLRNHFSTSVLHEGHLYGFDNATLKAVSIDDGQMTWGKRGLGKGSLIYADGHLLVLSDRGELLLLEARGDEYVEKSRFQALEGKSWTSPTLANGRLYLRNHTEMVAFDLAGEEDAS